MLKIALNAGHGLYTAGKRCAKSLDSKETREWRLNSRICEYIEEQLKKYTGYELVRCDDTTGKIDRSALQRAKIANDFGADIYISIHHNALGKVFSGSGIEAYVYTKVDNATEAWQKELYESVIKYTGLKGNRSQPLRKADFDECQKTRMAAVLIECGYMDSTVDVPIILTEDFARKVAQGVIEVLVKKGNLQKKPKQTQSSVEDNTMYYVQAGAFKERKNAEALVAKLKKAGFSAIIKN